MPIDVRIQKFTMLKKRQIEKGSFKCVLMFYVQFNKEQAEMRSQRIFDQVGKEIMDINQIQNGGSYFISSGEEFNNYNSNFQNSTLDQKQLVQYRISLLGMGSVGKSNLTTRWVNNEFFEDYSLTLLDKYTKKVTIGEQLLQVEIFDICGQEEYTSLRTQWMKDKEGLIFTYAINSIESFEDIKNTLLLYQQLFEKQENIPIIAIVGNKIDLELDRKVSSEDGKMLANQFKGLFFETSAKNGQNVNQMFTGLLNEIFQQKENNRKQQFQNLGPEQNQSKGWCQLI